jgi:hypothetical protein
VRERSEKVTLENEIGCHGREIRTAQTSNKKRIIISSLIN